MSIENLNFLKNKNNKKIVYLHKQINNLFFF